MTRRRRHPPAACTRQPSERRGNGGGRRRCRPCRGTEKTAKRGRSGRGEGARVSHPPIPTSPAGAYHPTARATRPPDDRCSRRDRPPRATARAGARGRGPTGVPDTTGRRPPRQSRTSVRAATGSGGRKVGPHPRPAVGPPSPPPGTRSTTRVRAPPPPLGHTPSTNQHVRPPAPNDASDRRTSKPRQSQHQPQHHHQCQQPGRCATQTPPHHPRRGNSASQ